METGKRGMPPGHRSTKAERESRIDQSAKWIIENPDATSKAFCDWFKAQFNIEARQAHKYKKQAYAALGSDKYSTNVEGARRAAVASLKHMLQDAETVKEKLAIRMELNKILGLYTQKIEVEQKKDVPLFNINLGTGEVKEE